MKTLFQSLSDKQKIDFFVQCQKLLQRFHPDSHFVIREGTLQKTIDSFVSHIKQYKGFVYSNEEICLLWNYIIISDPEDIKGSLGVNAYKEPNPDYNAVSIDFVVFKELKCCAQFIKENDEPRIKYVLFVRDGHPKIYKKAALLRNL